MISAVRFLTGLGTIKKKKDKIEFHNKETLITMLMFQEVQITLAPFPGTPVALFQDMAIACKRLMAPAFLPRNVKM